MAWKRLGGHRALLAIAGGLFFGEEKPTRRAGRQGMEASQPGSVTWVTHGLTPPICRPRTARQPPPRNGG